MLGSWNRVDGAGGGTRTRNPLQGKDFKSFAYTNSATPARLSSMVLWV